MDKDEIVNLIRRIQDSAIGLSNRIRELKEETNYNYDTKQNA